MKSKKAQLAIFIILAVFLVGVIVLVALAKNNNPTVEIQECVVDEDCFPAECCDSRTCVPVSEKPNCTIVNGTDIECPDGCYNYLTGELGCENFVGEPEGICKCINSKCLAVFN